MTKLEGWKAWHESLGIGMEATEHALEKGSHGKAFSYAWDAAVKAEREKLTKAAMSAAKIAIEEAMKLERETCAEIAEAYEPRCDVCPKGVAAAIRARR